MRNPLLLTAAFIVTLCSAGSAQQASWPAIVESTSAAIVVVETEKGQGSGFFVRSDGTLITNHHVIENAKSVAVRTSSGEVYRGALVMASDEARDLAILRVDAFDVPSVRMGNSNDVKVGSGVLLLGAPRGLEQTASTGIVAAVRVDDSGMRLIQTSAAASPGSSGGPLLNETGDVIGVLSFSVVQSQNLNFAVPINYARGILERVTSVGVKPEASLAPLAPASSNNTGSEPAAAPNRAPGGVYVTGFGPTEHLQRVYLELTEVLAQGGIRVVELRDVRTGGQMTSVSGLIEAAKTASADGVMYFTLSTGYGQTDRLRVQCYDRDGKLLWQEETTSLWQMTIDAAVGAVTKRMRDKLKVRIQKRQLPGQNAANQ
jgi:S1-C subfamily serine protease